MRELPSRAARLKWDLDNGIAEETAGGAATTFTWDRGAALPQVLMASQGSAFVYGLGLLAQQQDGAWTYPLPDGLGSLRQWLDAGGGVLSAAGYAAFGAPAWQRGAAPAAWGFAGEYHDPAGLLYLRARWYAPELGRFLTRDPVPGTIFRPGSLNSWAYVENNPVNRTDPSGRCWGPASFLRDVPGYDTTCDNLDMAILIAGHPQASAFQKAQAVAYVEAVAVPHIVLAEALAIIGYGGLLGGGAVGGTLNACQNSPAPARGGADPVRIGQAGVQHVSQLLRSAGEPVMRQNAYYQTPLGRAFVDIETSNRLIEVKNLANPSLSTTFQAQAQKYHGISQQIAKPLEYYFVNQPPSQAMELFLRRMGIEWFWAPIP